MAEHTSDSHNSLYLQRDNSWNHDLPDQSRLDPYLRRIVSLVEARDYAQLFLRTGVLLMPKGESPPNGKHPKVKQPQHLPLFVQIKTKDGKLAVTREYLKKSGLEIPAAYFEESERNNQLDQVTARMPVDAELAGGSTAGLRKALVGVLTDANIPRLSIATPLRPSLADAMSDIGLPADRHYKQFTMNGKGVIVGIIDDCCALAHRNYARLTRRGNQTKFESRIQYLWDQSEAAKPQASGWASPPEFGYGSELTKASITKALNRAGHVQNGVIREDKIYSYLGYEMTDPASHGTHVMDIAAGGGESIFGCEGMASDADIIFVQLPTFAIESGAGALSNYILDGVAYIFDRAASLGMPAVVNISYGGYAGPHDGSSPLEAGIDSLLNAPLTAHPGRTVVVAAGNGFEADCHARGTVQPNAAREVEWICRAEDPTSNQLEVWYGGNGQLDFSLATPGAGPVLGPVLLGEHVVIQRQSDQRIIGWIDHQKDPTNNDNKIVVTLNSTSGEDLSKLLGLVPPPGTVPSTAPAPSGVWKIKLVNTGVRPVDFHAWIERDDSGRGRSRRQQSRFAAAQADPGYTLAGLATGQNTIVIGAYNSATHEVCRYSACGPTRDGRSKPEVCAPAEELPTGRGILSASSARSLPTRMNGTSAAAPFVTGLVALMFQYARDANRGPLSVNDVRTKIMAAAQASAQNAGAALKLNAHQAADNTRPHKQKDVKWADLVGQGKIDVIATLDQI